MTVLITLTEDPLLRSWLYADNGDLISKIARIKPVYILVSEKEEQKVNQFLTENKLELSRIRIVPHGIKVENHYQRIIGFILRWSQKSDGSTRLRNLSYEKKLFNSLGLLLRRILAETVGSSKVLMKFYRWLYALYIDSDYVKLLADLNCQVLLCTSLTDIYPDVELLKAAKKLGVQSLGTPRSWDNLVSHGALRALPEKFLSHSQYMSECATKFQFIDRKSIIETGTSTYRHKFLPKHKSKRSLNRVALAIGCVGPNSNPSESAFICAFIPKIHEKFSNVDVTIIQHPRFPHEEKFDFENTREIRFEFTESDSLEKYYTTLKGFDLLLTSGSTIGLDATFVGTPVECFFIDLVDVGYWASSARYLTHRTHYRDFINTLAIKTHLSIESILASIDSISMGNPKVSPSANYFTGDSQNDFTDQILKSLRLKP